jgi:hypothetical protein
MGAIFMMPVSFQPLKFSILNLVSIYLPQFVKSHVLDPLMKLLFNYTDFPRIAFKLKVWEVIR